MLTESAAPQALPPGRPVPASTYSHSMVPGGFEVMS
jgi:hypothetical protein